MEQFKKLLTPDQVAEILNVSKATIYRLVQRRKLPCHKIGNVLRFQEKHIKEYLDQQEIKVIK